MKRTETIANETEFQEWLASVLEAERERLRQAVAEREIPEVQEFRSLKEASINGYAK